MAQRKKEDKSKLRLAMEFLSLAQSGKGEDQERYCILSQHTATVFNGVTAAGQVIDEDLEACPQTDALALALSRCGLSFSITQMPDDALLVRSGDFQAVVPCVKRERLTAAAPDAAIAVINDQLIDALRIVAPFADGKAEYLMAAAIQVRAGSAIATDMGVLIEAWHGQSLPSILIPKVAAVALIKSKRQLVSFGWSEKTATFWFEDGSWIRTQRYLDSIPDVMPMLQTVCDPTAIEPSFIEAFNSVAPWSEDSNVYCGRGFIRSHRHTDDKSKGARYGAPVEGKVAPRIYVIKHLKSVLKLIKTWDASPDRWTMFYGDNVRGAIAHSVYQEIAFDPSPLKHDVNGNPTSETVTQKMNREQSKEHLQPNDIARFVTCEFCKTDFDSKLFECPYCHEAYIPF